MRILCDARDRLGESPIWDHRCGRLLWLDIPGGVVRSWSECDGLRDLVRVESWIGLVALAGERDLMLGTDQGLVRWSADTGRLMPIADPLAGRHLRFNDGRVDAAGRLWAGAMTLDPDRYYESLGIVLCCDADGRTIIWEDGLTIPNGMDWSPDGTTFYLTDTMRRRIYAYDFDCRRGMLANRRLFADMGESSGRPDGLTVDQDGGVWSVSFRAGCARHYSPCGDLIATLALPVSATTAIAFGGTDLKQAFITSAACDDPDQQQSGAVFTLDMPVSGIVNHIFGMGQ